MATGAPHILPSLHIIVLSHYIFALSSEDAYNYIFAENAKRMVVWYDFFLQLRQRGVEDSRVANTLSYANCCIRRPAPLSLGDYF